MGVVVVVVVVVVIVVAAVGVVAVVAGVVAVYCLLLVVQCCALVVLLLLSLLSELFLQLLLSSAGRLVCTASRVLSRKTSPSERLLTSCFCVVAELRAYSSPVCGSLPVETIRTSVYISSEQIR